MLHVTEDESSDLDMIIPISVAVIYNNGENRSLKYPYAKVVKVSEPNLYKNLKKIRCQTKPETSY